MVVFCNFITKNKKLAFLTGINDLLQDKPTMNNETYSPINTPAWNNLIELASEIKTSASPTTIKQLFADDSERVEKYSLKAGELKLDFLKI